MKTGPFSPSLFLFAALLCASACDAKEAACEADVMVVERQRVALCQNKECGEVVFADECHATHIGSCGACQAGESCTPQGICAACTSDSQCPNGGKGYFCNAAYACEKYEDYCENNAECIDRGGGLCTDYRCADTSCGPNASCDAAKDERCLSDKCKAVVPLTACSLEGSTTAASTVVKAFAGFDGPENIYEYTASRDDLLMVMVTPADRTFDPAVYALSRLSPTPVVLTAADPEEQVAADEEGPGKSEVLMFTVEAGATYDIVVTSDSSQGNGQYKEGRYTICLESKDCEKSCAMK